MGIVGYWLTQSRDEVQNSFWLSKLLGLMRQLATSNAPTFLCGYLSEKKQMETPVAVLSAQRTWKLHERLLSRPTVGKRGNAEEFHVALTISVLLLRNPKFQESNVSAGLCCSSLSYTPKPDTEEPFKDVY